MTEEPIFNVTETMFQKLVEKYEQKAETEDTDQPIESSDHKSLGVENETQQTQSINLDSQ